MSSQIPPSFESLPWRSKKIAHWMLDGLSHHTKPFDGWKIYYDLGIRPLAENLVEIGYMRAIDGRRHLITPAGRTKLQELTALYGAPNYYTAFRSGPFPADPPNNSSLWAVHRWDNNDNHFVVECGLSREEAERKVAEFESHKHKLDYWVVYWVEVDSEQSMPLSANSRC
jgi:hypothetical protein